jgi:hypothetical protein
MKKNKVGGNPGFNPYFTGSTTSTIQRRRLQILIHRVSILILLEVPLQPCEDDEIMDTLTQ